MCGLRCCWGRSGAFWRRQQGVGVGNLYFGEKAIAAASHGFHKARTFRRVAESFADFVDRFVEPMIEVDEGVRGPEPFLKILASNNFAGIQHKHREDLKRLFLKPDALAVLAQFAGPEVHLENPEAEALAELRL